MPTIRVVTSVLAANSVAFPLAGSQYEYLPFNARVEFAIVTDAAAGDEFQTTVYSGTDVLQQQGPMSVKATAQPVYPDDFLLDDVAAAGERLSVELNQGTGGDLEVETTVKITPL